MPDDNKKAEKAAEKEKRDAKRGEKRAERKQWRIDKINALKEKFYAVATKRKWLVFLIGISLIAYLVISSGGIGFGGILEKIKVFF